MTIMFVLFGLGAALELSMHLVAKWPAVRTALASIAVVVCGFTAGVSLALAYNTFTLLLAILLGYRVFNLLRIVQKRMHDRYLRFATRRTSLVLFGLQAVVAILWAAWERWGDSGHVAWSVIGILQAVLGLALLAVIIRNLRQTAWPAKGPNAYSDKELPSVTVAIPARNETEDLQRCLESVIASDYPKLEILVLDDCSQTRRTPEIIREFAQDGVRFVQGHEPSATWLPKNEAYAQLADEASGSYILFCGADVRFTRQSIRTMVTTMLDRNKQMMSVLPQRRLEAYGNFSLIQAMRYWWELAPPRRQLRRPPVLSTCWMIKRSALEAAGGFKAVARAVVPEAHFARHVIQADGYSFLRSGEALGIQSVKRVEDQRDTAIRMRYPQMHRRPEQVVLLTILEAVFLIMPFAVSIAGFWVSIGTIGHVSALIASALFACVYVLSSVTTHVNTLWFAVVAQPFAAITDIILLHYSMWKYEFSVVDWKGRNVCVPVMHVMPRLPDAKS